MKRKKVVEHHGCLTFTSVDQRKTPVFCSQGCKVKGRWETAQGMNKRARWWLHVAGWPAGMSPKVDAPVFGDAGHPVPPRFAVCERCAEEWKDLFARRGLAA